GHRALDRTAERGGDGPDHAQPVLNGAPADRLDLGLGLGHAALDVGLVVRLRGRQDRADRVGPEAPLPVLQTAVEAPLVRHQSEIGHPGLPPDPAQDVLGVGELWEVLGVGVGHRFDLGEADLGGPVDEPDLQVGRDEGVLVLQSVPREALAEDDGIRQAHHVPPGAPRIAAACPRVKARKSRALATLRPSWRNRSFPWSPPTRATSPRSWRCSAESSPSTASSSTRRARSPTSWTSTDTTGRRSARSGWCVRVARSSARSAWSASPVTPPSFTGSTWTPTFAAAALAGRSWTPCSVGAGP